MLKHVSIPRDHPIHEWVGQQARYTYQVFPLGIHFKDLPGNYIYARQDEAGGWQALFVGHTHSLGELVSDHAAEDCARGHGATHVHAHRRGESLRSRELEAEDLIQTFDPVCNRATD